MVARCVRAGDDRPQLPVLGKLEVGLSVALCPDELTDSTWHDRHIREKCILANGALAKGVVASYK